MEECSQCSKPKSKGTGKAKANDTNTKVTQHDMYKYFDGSALLCIGMSPFLLLGFVLFQESLGMLLQSHIFLSLQN